MKKKKRKNNTATNRALATEWEALKKKYRTNKINKVTVNCSKKLIKEYVIIKIRIATP